GGLGDVAIDAKATVLPRETAPIGLAFVARVGLPTATVHVPLSGLAAEGAVVADQKVGPLLLAANLGVRGAPAIELDNATLGSQLFGRAGAAWTVGGAGL